MGWNGPDKGSDPWGGKKQPPDLDAALKQLQQKLKQLLFKRTGKNKGQNIKFKLDDHNYGRLGSLIMTIFFVIWLLSGFFIVDPAEQAAILRLGRYVKTVGPGPHWIFRFIESKTIVNVDKIADYSYSAQMLTKDENLVLVSLAVQYHVGDLESYLFNVADPIQSLKQATSSALRQVVGTTTLDEIITEGREAWGKNVQNLLVKILDKYKTGIVILNVSPQPARAPEDVQDAFDDAIKAQEDEKRFKKQANAYQSRVVPIAQGNAKRQIEEAQAYAKQVVLRATGEVAEFLAILPEYLKSPKVMSERMYLDTLEHVLIKSRKIMIEGKAGNMFYLPLDKLTQPTPPLPLPSLEEQAAKIGADKTQTNNDTISGRRYVRQTIRSGRSN